MIRLIYTAKAIAKATATLLSKFPGSALVAGQFQLIPARGHWVFMGELMGDEGEVTINNGD